MQTTIELDDVMTSRLQRFVPPHDLNRFITAVLADKLAQLEQTQATDVLIAGYKAARRERHELVNDWAVADTEGWPE